MRARPITAKEREILIADSIKGDFKTTLWNRISYSQRDLIRMQVKRIKRKALR